MGRLEGKTVLVTGGTAGIGFRSAALFADEGATVAITGRSQGSLDLAISELSDGVVPLQLNVTDVGQIEQMVTEIGQRFGHLDGLLVNAGVAMFRTYENMDEETFDTIIDTNVKGAWFTTARCAPLVRAGGSIVLISSIAAHGGRSGASVYAASKAAVRSMAKNFAAELVGEGVRVNALSPGATKTRVFDTLGTPEEVERIVEGMEAQIPMKRVAVADEIARAALFLISDESSYMTGSELVVDGGKSQI